MKIYIADAFAKERFCGNQAGVVIFEKGEAIPEDKFMQKLAAELKHSETAYLRKTGDRAFELRYFTPEREVELCGHATVASFSVLRDEGLIMPGEYIAETKAGKLNISVGENAVWMDMAEPMLMRIFTEDEAAPMYEAFGLSAGCGLPAELISTGLADIILPVKDLSELNGAVMDREMVKALSEKYGSVGFHMFCMEADPAHCRNFAPLVGIDEECATGTANGALTCYLVEHGLSEPGRENLMIQGEAMGRRSEIRTIMTESGKIKVGGSAVVSLCCSM